MRAPLGVLAALVACALGLAARAPAASVTTPASPVTIYLVVDGPRAGDIFVAIGDTVRERAVNGVITADQLFHGSIDGRKIVAPVVAYEPRDIGGEFASLTGAITLEWDVLDGLEHGSISRGSLRSSIENLMATTKDPVLSGTAGAMIRAAVKDDGVALTAGERLADGTESAEAATRIVRVYVERALVQKRKAFAATKRYYLPDPSEKVTVTDFGPGAATAISPNGLLTGYLGTPTQHNAFVANGGTIFKLFQPSGGVGAVVLPDGTVGGQASNEAGFWSPGGAFTPVPGLGGPTGRDNVIRTFFGSTWYGKSDNPFGIETPTQWTSSGGVSAVPGAPAVGEIFDANGNRFAGTFYSGSTFFGGLVIGNDFTSLGDPAGGSDSAAYTVNGLGIVGGSAWYSGNTNSTAELWWGKKHESLTPSSQDSFINSLNDSAWGFGANGTPTQHHGTIFLWHHTYDVNSLVQGSTSLTITNVTDGNDSGQMSAIGRDPNGIAHALLLTPVK